MATLCSIARCDQYSVALELAERFVDMRTMIEICDQMERHAQLEHYHTQFADKVRQFTVFSTVSVLHFYCVTFPFSI